MGGTFSGCRWDKKRVVESCDAIDTAELKRWHLLRPGTNRSGSLEWRRGNDEKPSSVSYTMTVADGGGSFRLQYKIGQPPERFDYPVQLVKTSCHLGGVRWWFICPLTKNGTACGRRARKLYLCGKYFGCRHCHALTYRSRQESDSRVYALARAGLDAMPAIGRASVSQLGLTLKALALMQKRAERSAR
ncbi:hypothetical protein [Frigoriglobus tundricola]|uniref:Uncharacterized protein n=1 Tax=Frigoriglobus tundricola TaxID=2774151 RepID=A0A6M5YH22_9BACT|nr:hypothetical protein [Frigoriglobus tundricola]QJW92543.1 hypothetical protein FTUN_0039 [Frigoriglobus tundricola]